MLNLKVLGSSSSGNCYLIFTKDKALIIEAGVQYKKIQQGLNFKLNNVAGALITHAHKDHCSSIVNLLNAGIDVYSEARTLELLSIKHHRAKAIKAQEQFEIDGFTILPFDVEHDVIESMGFLIHHPDIGKILFATDTSYIRYKFSGVNYFMLECNYSKAILDKNVEAGLLDSRLKRRLLSSHFSLENVKEFLKANDLSKAEEIMLLHLSNNNSDAQLFKSEIERLTGVPVRVC